MSELQAGMVLAGYRVVGLLGRGGMGVVYEVEHSLLSRKAALKTLNAELASQEEFRQRFIEESQTAAAVEHPNIIPIYDAGRAEGFVYIAMRYVDGSDLKEVIDREGRLDPERTMEVLEQAAAALDAAHARELVHRDVKPANLLLEASSGRVYLTDFGFAKRSRTRGVTRPEFFVGTLDYAAPEQIRGELVGPPADVYAFGCVLFECLTGKKPFDRETDVAVMHAHLLDPPASLTVQCPDLPSGLEDVVAQALSKTEAERFDSCRELIEAARAALGGTAPLAVSERSTRGPDKERRSGVSSGLPLQLTALVGRSRELGEAEDLLRVPGTRLLTLTGPGGTGKTRLAIELASTVGPELGGAVFIDLAPIRDSSLVPSTVSQALGIDDANRPLPQALGARLAGGPMLLILDNFEHVLGSAELIMELLAAAPGLKVLTTSQVPLHIRGEQEYAVPALELPKGAGDAAAISSSAAVSLFVERARAVKPDFRLTDENASTIAEVCGRLDGLPLALELAAARTKLLSPQAILSRLDDALDFLAADVRDLPQRQRTLRNTIDWSYGLLEEPERVILARLGVFVGGCSLEGAEMVCGRPDGIGVGEILERLASLVDKSLMRQWDGADGEPRFRMLETVRQYALRQLEERGELDDLRRRHAERYTELVEAAEPELVRTAQVIWLQRLDEEYDNVRAALAWSLEAEEPELGLRIASALVRYWSTRGLMAEGRRWLMEAFERSPSAPKRVLARGHFAAGYAALGQGDYSDATPHYQESLELARRAGDVSTEAAALAQLGWLAMAEGDFHRAEELADRSLAFAHALGDRVTASGALNVLAEIAAERGDGEEAVDKLEWSLRLRRELGDKRLVSNSLLNLGSAELARGQSEEAATVLQEALALARELRDSWSASRVLAELGRVDLQNGQFESAQRLFSESLTLATERGDKRVIAESLQGLAIATAGLGDDHGAAKVLGAAEALRESIGAVRTRPERLVYDRFVPPLRDRLGVVAFETEWAAGRTLSSDAAIALARGNVQPGAESPAPR